MVSWLTNFFDYANQKVFITCLKNFCSVVNRHCLTNEEWYEKGSETGFRHPTTIPFLLVIFIYDIIKEDKLRVTVPRGHVETEDSKRRSFFIVNHLVHYSIPIRWCRNNGRDWTVKLRHEKYILKFKVTEK